MTGISSKSSVDSETILGVIHMVNNNQTHNREADEIIETEIARVRYHRSTETYLAAYEWESDQSLSATLAVIIEAISDGDSTGRPPLFDRVDTDALDKLFEPTGNNERDRRAGRIIFPYCEFLVTVHADGEIVISSKQEASER